MRAYIATGILGTFAFGSKGELLEHRLFPKDPELIAERVGSEDITPEEKEITEGLIGKGYKEIIWDKWVSLKGAECMYMEGNLARKKLQEEFRKLAIDMKWVSKQAELNELMSKVNVILTGKKLKVVKKDKIVMQAVGVVDELDKTMNTLSERLAEWYGLHFPEARRVIHSQEKFAEIVARYGGRGAVKDKKLAKFIEKSVGMDFSGEDVKAVQDYSKTILELHKTREGLVKYLDGAVGGVAPNMTALAGSLMAARLLALAGGLEKISKLPSSTIQLLGAEKALFRHLRGGGKSPKYGIIFGHPHIQNAPKNLKGRVARLIASKLALAARFDAFSGKDRGKEMKKELDEQVKKILGKA